METNNFKSTLFDDLKALQHTVIPTLSAKKLYGQLFKYLVVFWSFMIGITMLGDWLLLNFWFKHVAQDKLDIILLGIVLGGGFALFLSIGLAGAFQKLIIFKQTIKPLMKTGESVHQKIRFICSVYIGIYLFVLTIFSLYWGLCGLSHFPAIVGTLLIGNAFLQGEITRLGIPELPKILERIAEGKPISFN
jgi:hypothetical protein